jgi:hypothetical protein
MQSLNHSVRIHMLIMFLHISGYCGKHETAYIECIITSLLMSSIICSTRTSREVIRIQFWKNIISFLLPENNSQVAVPIHKCSSIELFLLKLWSQIKSGCVTCRHDLQQEINSKFFITRLCTNLILTNLIKDIPHSINIALPLTTYSGARFIFIKILVSFAFTTRKLMT